MKLIIIIGQVDTNSFVIEENRHVIIIDPAEAEPIAKAIDDCSWTPDYILLTHEHFDHISGLEELRNRYKVPVIASELSSERIQDMRENLSRIADILQYYKTGVAPETRTQPFVCEAADITFDEEYELDWQGHKFSFRRAPGHSPGSTIISLDDHSVFTGDYMFFDAEETLRLKGGSEEEYNAKARPILDALPADCHIYPGHGKDYLKGQKPE
ncbi:MAG: MBL fold metallo-hydrolase [Bacillota bacterium]|nr:MBL fold metallo-hydrolase [Bacillota bacterium]